MFAQAAAKARPTPTPSPSEPPTPATPTPSTPDVSSPLDTSISPLDPSKFLQQDLDVPTEPEEVPVSPKASGSVQRTLSFSSVSSDQ